MSNFHRYEYFKSFPPLARMAEKGMIVEVQFPSKDALTSPTRKDPEWRKCRVIEVLSKGLRVKTESGSILDVYSPAAVRVEMELSLRKIK